MKRLRYWLHSWAVFFHLLREQRRKRHGRGKRDWPTAIYIANCGRWLVYGQHVGGRHPTERLIARSRPD